MKWSAYENLLVSNDSLKNTLAIFGQILATLTIVKEHALLYAIACFLSATISTASQ